MSERYDEPVIPRFGSHNDDDAAASSRATVTDEQPVVPRFEAGVGGTATSASQWGGPASSPGSTGFWSADDKEPVASRGENADAAADDDSVIVILPEDVVTPDDDDDERPNPPAADDTAESSRRGWRAPWSSARSASDEQDDADQSDDADESDAHQAPAADFAETEVRLEPEEPGAQFSEAEDGVAETDKAAIGAELAEADLDTAHVNSADAGLADADADAGLADAEADSAEAKAAAVDTETSGIETSGIETPDTETSHITTPGMVPDEVAPAHDSGTLDDSGALDDAGLPDDSGLSSDESIAAAELAGDESIDDAPLSGSAVLADDSDLVGGADGTVATDLAVDSSPSLGASSGETGVAGAVADERWREIMVGFVDDPRSSVQAAAGLVEDEIAAYTARLAERQQAMRGAWSDDDAADTEALRVALKSYRSFREQFAGLAAKLDESGAS